MVHIYIGAEKTSTTYLQRLFRQNHEALQSEAHVQYLFGPKLSKSIVKAAKGEDTNLQFPKFERGGQNIIISEFFYRDLASADEVERFAEIFRSRFEDVSVFLYVRDQVAWIESFYSTALKNGAAWEFSEFVDHALKNIRTLDFHLNVQMWQSIFGKNLHVYQYSGNNLLPEILDRFSVDAQSVGVVEPPPSNIALSVKQLAFLRNVNEAFSTTEKLRPHPKKLLRKKIVRMIENLDYGEGKIRVDDAMRSKIISRYQQGNAAMNETWNLALPTSV